MENKGGNAKNGIGMRVWSISMGMQGIWVEIQEMWGIRFVMQRIKVEKLSIAVEIT